MAKELIIPTREEMQATLEKYGRFVAPEFLRRRTPLEAEVLSFCEAKLNAEYRAAALEMLEALELDSPETFGRGDEKIWSAGFWHALLQQNFGFDSSATPRIKVRDVTDFYAVKVGSMQQRSTTIRDALGLDPLDGRFLIPATKTHIKQLHQQMAETVALLAGAPLEQVMAEMPRFGRPGKSKTEFVDHHRPAMEDFYDIGSGAARISADQLESELLALIERDPDFFDTYSMLAGLLRHHGHDEKAQEFEEEAGRRAQNLVCSRTGHWPQKLEWSWIENRHIIRALSTWAQNLWHDGQTDEALELFRHLLASNPEDQIGTRQCILALRLGLKAENWYESFTTSDGELNEKKLSKWFEKESKKFPEDFADGQRTVKAD